MDLDPDALAAFRSALLGYDADDPLMAALRRHYAHAPRVDGERILRELAEGIDELEAKRAARDAKDADKKAAAWAAYQARRAEFAGDDYVPGLGVAAVFGRRHLPVRIY